MQKVYTKIESIVGNVISVKADGVRSGDLAEVTTSTGKSYANVIKYVLKDCHEYGLMDGYCIFGWK